MARYNNFVATPSIFESLVLTQIELYGKTILTDVLHRREFIMILFFGRSRANDVMILAILAIVFSLFTTLSRFGKPLRRGTKRGKFSRAAWEFEVVLNSRQREIAKQKLSKSITFLQYLLNFAPTLGNLKCFNREENRSCLDKQVLIILVNKEANFCQQVLKRLGSYRRFFTVITFAKYNFRIWATIQSYAL